MQDIAGTLRVLGFVSLVGRVLTVCVQALQRCGAKTRQRSKANELLSKDFSNGICIRGIGWIPESSAHISMSF